MEYTLTTTATEIVIEYIAGGGTIRIPIASIDSTTERASVLGINWNNNRSWVRLPYADCTSLNGSTSFTFSDMINTVTAASNGYREETLLSSHDMTSDINASITLTENCTWSVQLVWDSYAYTTTPADVTIQGSNDNSNWITLNLSSLQPYQITTTPGGTHAIEKEEFKYKYYRLKYQSQGSTAGTITARLFVKYIF